jgi:hypothetical protein
MKLDNDQGYRDLVPLAPRRDATKVWLGETVESVLHGNIYLLILPGGTGCHEANLYSF